MTTLNTDHSWVVIETATNQAIMETWQPSILAKINRERYHAMPITEWLAFLSKSETSS